MEMQSVIGSFYQHLKQWRYTLQIIVLAFCFSVP